MEIEKEIEALQARNRRVEADKAWESSRLRRFFIIAVTYTVALVWLWVIDEKQAWLKAVVPAAGYLLSTVSLSFLRHKFFSK